MATTPFLVGSAGSGSTATLTISVGTSTANGDNLKIGIVVNTANAIPAVADTQGNMWALSLSDVTETGAQLYVFECPGAAALTSGTDTITVTTAAA